MMMRPTIGRTLATSRPRSALRIDLTSVVRNHGRLRPFSASSP